MAVEVASITIVQINSITGQIVDKSSPSTTIKDTLQTRQEHRIMPKQSNSNTSGYPTIEEYLQLEDAAGRKLAHMDQFIIVTQS